MEPVIRICRGQETGIKRRGARIQLTQATTLPRTLLLSLTPCFRAMACRWSAGRLSVKAQKGEESAGASSGWATRPLAQSLLLWGEAQRKACVPLGHSRRNEIPTCSYRFQLMLNLEEKKIQGSPGQIQTWHPLLESSLSSDRTEASLSPLLRKANEGIYVCYLTEIPHSQHGVPKRTTPELAD